MKKNKSIKLKIFLYYSIFSIVLIAILWFFQIVFLDSFYKWIKTQSLKSAASAVERNIGEENLSEIVEEIALNYETCIHIKNITADDAEPVNFHIAGNCTVHKPMDELWLAARIADAGGEILEEFQNTNPPEPRTGFGEEERNFVPGAFPRKNNNIHDSINFYKVITLENGDAAILAVGSSITPVNSTVQTLQIQLYFVTGFMLVISTLMAIYLSRKVARPIERINKEAAILGTGDYDVEFSGGGYKEIDELSQTLNYTASELKKADGLQKELIANISHDLRTPLTLIAGYAEAMRDLPGEATAENAQVIIDESKRLNSLVKDVLDLSKIQSGINELSLKEFSITNMLKGDIRRMSEFLNKDGYDFIFTYHKDVVVLADEAKISQVVHNLLSNAIHYTGSDKKIYITQLEEKDYVKIEITDTGAGIDEDELENIWERYYKSGENHRRNIQGTGLGLSIVKSIMKLHGCKYGVNSVKNQGSTFYFYLKKAKKS